MPSAAAASKPACRECETATGVGGVGERETADPAASAESAELQYKRTKHHSSSTIGTRPSADGVRESGCTQPGRGAGPIMGCNDDGGVASRRTTRGAPGHTSTRGRKGGVLGQSAADIDTSAFASGAAVFASLPLLGCCNSGSAARSAGRARFLLLAANSAGVHVELLGKYAESSSDSCAGVSCAKPTLCITLSSRSGARTNSRQTRVSWLRCRDSASARRWARFSDDSVDARRWRQSSMKSGTWNLSDSWYTSTAAFASQSPV